MRFTLFNASYGPVSRSDWSLESTVTTTSVKCTLFRMLFLSDRSYSPVAAPSTGGFGRICPQGARHGCRAFFAGAGMPLRKTPSKPFGAQESSGMGWLFLWILSFGHTKESIAVAGPRTGVKLIIATRYLKNKQHLRNFKLVPCGLLPHRTLRAAAGAVFRGRAVSVFQKKRLAGFGVMGDIKLLFR